MRPPAIAVRESGEHIPVRRRFQRGSVRLAHMQPLRNPFDTDGLGLRCALHAHTTESDGELPPAMLAEHYRRAGYDVLAITDHWRRTAATSLDGLLVIASSEINVLLPEERDGHLLT